jgi:PPOX class probable F420-dependent enzyme
MDLQYKVYDGVRHPRAFEVARKPGAAVDFSALRDARQALVVTFKRSGQAVPTPVNFGLDEEGRLYFRSEPHVAKIRRIRRDPHVRVGPCNVRAKPLGPLAEGRARVLSPEESDRAYAAIEANWSPPMRVFEKGADRIGIDMVYVEIEPLRKDEI